MKPKGTRGWNTQRGWNVQPAPIEHMGKKRTMQQLSEQTGLPLMTLYQRWHRGDRDEKLVRPKDPRGGGRRRRRASTVTGDA
jgi:hypothetical protein